MRLSWNEVRTRAATFAENWRDASYEKGETQSFYNAFFEVFGVRRRSVARFEARVAKLDHRPGYIDLFWPGVLIVEHKSAGHNLKTAYEQASEYFDALPEHERPRYILVSDFQNFELYDLDERQHVVFQLGDFPTHVESFGFILGVQRRTFRDQDPANIKAAELVGKLYDALSAAGHRGHDLERLLVRIVFCMFADDTGVFEPRDTFLDLMETRTREDGTDLGQWLTHLFEVINTPEDTRPATLDDDLARFPYVDGALFSEHLQTPAFDTTMRKVLLDACRFDWSVISPAIFGTLFQSVMQPAERRELGAHYTTEKNILKVIEPLFMDDLRSEFRRLQARKPGPRRLAALRQFQKKLGEQTFFDPACGCGNFLIIAYRELRLLETEVIREIRDATRKATQAVLDVKWTSLVDVDQFYGIEIGEFAVRIAETALWMMDHIMNNRLSLELGQTYVRIPLDRAPHIWHRDALETDWSELLPPDRCSFILGNPPFVGAKLQTVKQRNQVRKIADLSASGGTLDYVAAWFLKAGEYVMRGEVRIGLVATNSVTQGEQVAQLWPLLFDRYQLEIAFAHRTFAWGSDARGKAQVHVVIIGLEHQRMARAEKRLFTYPDHVGEPEESRHSALSPYLFDAGRLSDPHLTVQEASRPINGARPLIIGSKPIDGGNYIFGAAEREALLAVEPEAARWLRPYVGAREFLENGERWILALHNASPAILARLPEVRRRMVAVRSYRENSKSTPTRKLAATPTLYHVNVTPSAPFLAIPETSSEQREYVPIGWLQPPTIPSNALKVLLDATLMDFALLTSAMHMAWLRHIGGRLGSGYRYSIGPVYNTFPLPPTNKTADAAKLKQRAKAVLDARAKHPNVTLANLYAPDLMPPNLRRAHQALDRAVDQLYRRAGFDSEQSRIEHLLMLYEKMCSPLETKVKPKSSRRKKKLSQSWMRNP